MDNLLFGNLISLTRKTPIPELLSSAAAQAVSFRPKAERRSGVVSKLFGFPSESAFAFSPESRSELDRNSVRDHPGTVFEIARIPQQPV